METTVDFQTAKELRDAGFPQPEPKVGQFWQSPSWDRRAILCRRIETGEIPMLAPLSCIEWSHNFNATGPFGSVSVFLPTALEIIEQMPNGTHIKKNPDGLWYVWFELPGFQRDFRHDTCPHKAAAMAYIAWKKGQQ